MRVRLTSALCVLALGYIAGACQAAGPVPVLPRPVEETESAPINLVQYTNESLPAGIEGEPSRESSGRFFAEAGFLLLKLHMQNNVSYLTRSTDIQPGSGDTNTGLVETDFNNPWGVAPKISLGYVNDQGFGVRGNWFLFQSRSHASVGANDPKDTGVNIISAVPFGSRFIDNGAIFDVAKPDDHINVSSPSVDGLEAEVLDFMVLDNRITLNVLDLEATQEFKSGLWSVLASGGVRYARLRQSYHARQFHLNEDTNTYFNAGDLNSTNNFSGVGPTLAAELRRPLGNTGFALFGSARGTILFGHRQLSADQFEYNSVGEVESHDAFNKTDNNNLPTVEFEVGGQYSRPIGRMGFFLQAGFTSQTWFGAGSATSADGNLGLVGLRFTAGLNF